MCPRARSRKKITVVITLPSSTMNMTGFRTWLPRVELRERVADRGEHDVPREDALRLAGHYCLRLRVECEVELEHVHARLAEEARGSGRRCSRRSAARRSRAGVPRTAATRRACRCAYAGEMSGSMPEPRGRDGVHGDVADRQAAGCTGRSSFRIAAAAVLTFLASSGLVGPRFEKVVRAGVVGRRRGGRALVEVPRALELLRGELRADDLAVRARSGCRSPCRGTRPAATPVIRAG